MKQLQKAVFGVDVTEKTQCRHWHSDQDIVAIKFPCCDQYFACYDCHKEVADHPAETWPREKFPQLAILCGNCGEQLTILAYLECEDRCPQCAARFNPGCRLHRHLYFEV